MIRQLALFSNPQGEPQGEAPRRVRKGFAWKGPKRPLHQGPTITPEERAAASAAHEAAHPVPHCAPTAVIDAIRVLSPGVDVEYLTRFDESALRLYLAHLESSRMPRGRGARWERPGDTRAIRVCRPPEEV
ncbi:MAG: hypothetical protein ACTS3F_07310 [Phycisphaerales bacterium]